ncbi:MAG: hypothetical protein IT441_04605 [Phycisphaeraceae bacterium]|nr:hypothetical protein [Phycisphaeraceae bacterium]
MRSSIRSAGRAVPVRCGEVLVHPGEIVLADFDGIVVIPRKVEDEVLRLAMIAWRPGMIARRITPSSNGHLMAGGLQTFP